MREEKHKRYKKYTISIHHTLSICVFNEPFYTSPRTQGLTEVLTVLQCSLRAPTLTPNYIPHGISFLTASRFTHRSGPTYAPVCVPVYAFGLTDRSQPIRSSASSADLADVELVSQHFVTTMCNALATTVKYYKVTSSIRPKDAQRKLFVHNSASDVYVQPSNAKIQSKSGDTRTCNYCKKPRHIKAE